MSLIAIAGEKSVITGDGASWWGVSVGAGDTYGHAFVLDSPVRVMAAAASKVLSLVRWVIGPCSGCLCQRHVLHQTKVFRYHIVAMVFTLARLVRDVLPMLDIPAEGPGQPKEVAARMENTAILTHDVVSARGRRCIFVAVETGGAGIRPLGESGQSGRVHCMAAVTGGHTTCMEGQSSGAQAEGDERCDNKN